MPRRHAPCPDCGMSTDGPCSHPMCFFRSQDEKDAYARDLAHREHFALTTGKTEREEANDQMGVMVAVVLIWIGVAIGFAIGYWW